MAKLGTLWQIGRTFGLRDGLLRASYEAQRGSGVLYRRMQSVAGWDRWDLHRIAPNVSPQELLAGRRQGAHKFFFSDARTFAAALKKILGAEGEAEVIGEANQILEGNLPFFGKLSFACGFPPRWFENPVTGQRVAPNRLWTKMRFASPADDYGDLKFILEPSRFLFVYPLARAYALSADERFAAAFWSAIESWHASNPPMSGPLWICGQESSLRIMAWSFGLHAFIHSSVTTPDRVAMLVSMIAAHAWRTMQTVGYARSQRSNHLISEAVGLWTAGTLYPELTDASAWQKHGASLLREAVRDQITAEGAYLQDSFNYQRMVLQQLFWTLRLAEIHGIELSAEIRERTSAAFGFIGRFVDAESGQAPNHGSNDGSHILPLAQCDYGDYRPLLRMGRSVLNLPATLPPGKWDETAVWLCGESADGSGRRQGHDQDSAAMGQTGGVGEFGKNSSGYHRIGTAKSWAFIQAGHYSRRPFQADQLHVDLWWRGINLARDPGTYLYNGDPPWDNGLAGTAVHNTVMVDGHDQMRRAGRFLWLDWAQASGKSFSDGDEKFLNCFEGEHDGYRRLGVRHRRKVQCVKSEGASDGTSGGTADGGAWFIVDDLYLDVDFDVNSEGGRREGKSKAGHELRVHWLLPGLPIEVIADSPFSAVLSERSQRFRWTIFSSAPGTATVIRAGKSEYGKLADSALMGWQSPTYGELCAAVSLIYKVQARLPVRIITAILDDEGLKLSQREGQLLLLQGETEIYRVSLAPAGRAKASGETIVQSRGEGTRGKP